MRRDQARASLGAHAPRPAIAVEFLGMRELASEHLQSGVANTASALVQLLGLVLGVEVGRSIAASWFGDVQVVAAPPEFGPAHLVAAADLVGATAGPFFATLTVGLAGGFIGSRPRRSPLVFIVPGVLMLVPGSAGFDSVLQLLSNQTVSGITTAFDTFVTATSIAYGLMVSAVLLPGRFSVTPRR